MIIQKKRIRNIYPYISHIAEGSKFIIGISSPERFALILESVGFPSPFKKGDSLLPKGSGPVSSYNAEGKEIVHRDKPMETVYRQAIWHWKEWAGRYETVERSKIVDIPYPRYPRSFDPPPGIELNFSEDQDGNLLLVSLPYQKTTENENLIKHTINLFLELFGECQFFTNTFDSIIKTTVVRLNWEILPRGEMPWQQFKKHLDPLIKLAPKGNRPVLEYRLETINGYEPDFRAIGRGGFHGYIIHGFSNRGLFVLESIYYGNATYVFGEKWEELSKRTKAEILNEKLQKDRIIHSEEWEDKITNLMKQKKEVSSDGKK
ncbi:MAG: hypothetical protein WC775_04190 [Patescibacteria group bacterium]|jgi:hypothetical protein